MAAHSASTGESAAGASSASPYANPSLMCDIVMKGGITSGVVYPGAILQLARRYRFRSIGGTSAGAIAAAVLAAAEHARRNGSVAGFDVIARLPGELGGGTKKEPFMLQLFQADKSTRTLFAAILGFMRRGKLRAILGILVAFWRATLLAAVVAVASIVLSTWGGADAAFAVAGVGAAVAILVIGLAGEILRALRAIGDNDFGICRLGPEVGSPTKPALTAWLHRRIQQAAGHAEDAAPVTFADLWGADAGSGPASGDETRLRTLCAYSRDPESRDVDLQMMTTDLTQGRPLRLPVLYDRHEPRLEDGAGMLLFDRVELRRFFPRSVVEHLERVAEPLGDTAVAVALREYELFGHVGPVPRLLRMPIGPDLPVLVATRMSLSFPLLISAVPLWRLVFAAQGAPPTVQRVIFSDGGITSNFPIHFFDSPLPTRPTFGLQLTSAPAGTTADPADPSQWVVPPPTPSGQAPEPARDILDLKGFAAALKDAAQNWRDNAQARLPGFRDRIEQIKLAAGEGGLNLNMDPKVIEHLNERGRRAGDDLRELFSGTDPVPVQTDQWNEHRFTRYRMTMAVMERLMHSYHRGYTACPDVATKSYAELIVAGQDNPPYPFETLQRREAAQATSDAYAGLVPNCSADVLDDANVPRPPATMRTVPPV